jgi:hypothetical protein
MAVGHTLLPSADLAAWRTPPPVVLCGQMPQPLARASPLKTLLAHALPLPPPESLSPPAPSHLVQMIAYRQREGKRAPTKSCPLARTRSSASPLVFSPPTRSQQSHKGSHKSHVKNRCRCRSEGRFCCFVLWIGEEMVSLRTLVKDRIMAVISEVGCLLITMRPPTAHPPTHASSRPALRLARGSSPRICFFDSAASLGWRRPRRNLVGRS